MTPSQIPAFVVERHRRALAEHWTAPVQCSRRGLGWGCTCGASGFPAEATTMQEVAQSGAEHITLAALAAVLEGCDMHSEVIAWTDDDGLIWQRDCVVIRLFDEVPA